MAAVVERVMAAQDNLSSPVELRFSAEGLIDADAGSSVSDPIVFLLAQDSAGQYKEVGRTEVIQNDLTPVWQTAINMDFNFERVQKLRIAIYDSDGGNDVKNMDFLGQADVTLANVVNAPGQKQVLPLTMNGQPRGRVTISAEERSRENAQITLSLRAFNLDSMDTFSKSDPFVMIYRAREDGSWTLVHRTEWIKDNNNPTWAPIKITSQALCNGDWDRTLKLEVYDYDEGDNDEMDLIGTCTTNLRELAALSRKDMELVNEKKKAKSSKYRNSGVLNVVAIDIQKVYGLLEFLAGGLEIGVVVAIDYTASNGAPCNRSSLHYKDVHSQNEYEKTIQGVVEVLEPYDNDGMIATVGFGAAINGETKHCFPVAYPDTWFVHGTQGILAAYENSFNIPGFKLNGPTNFAPTLTYAIQMATQTPVTQEFQKYYVLLIMTDGEISDMETTISCLVDASDVPLSVIIVGVGACDFENMNKLDGDGGSLRSGMKVASRDVVQFVPFRDFSTKGPAELAAAVLAEVPAQLTAFMKKRGITPNPRRAAPPPPPYVQPGPSGAALPPPADLPPPPAY